MASAVAAAERDYPPRATHVAHAWLRSPLYLELQSEACRRVEHVDELAAKIIAAAIVLGEVDELITAAEMLLAR